MTSGCERENSGPLTDEVTEHLLGCFEVGDHPVTKRPRRADVCGGAADHPPRVCTDRDHASGQVIDRDHRRLEEHDPVAAPKYHRIRRAQIDAADLPARPPSYATPTPRTPPRQATERLHAGSPG